MPITAARPSISRPCATPIDRPDLPQYSLRQIAAIWAAAALEQRL